jgi:large subunit ribosomal protein L31e
MAKKIESKTNTLEREYTIPLRVEWKKVPRYQRAAKAIKAIKEFLVRHMKIYNRDLKKVKINKYLNEQIWIRGIKSPPHKIKVKAIKEGDIVRVDLVHFPERLKFKKLREEKLEKSSKEAKEKKKSLKEKMQESVQGKKEDEKKDSVISDEKKVDEVAKAKSGENVSQKIEKVTAKKSKHQVGGKTKEPKRQKRMALAK